MARESLMDKHPDLRVLVADKFVEGASNQEIADAINAALPQLPKEVHRETIPAYRRHPSVEALIARRRRERINLITSKIDSKIEAWLTNTKINHDIETLLKIRKELMPERTKEQGGDDMNEDTLVEELFDKAYEDPDFAERMKDAVDRIDESAPAAAPDVG
jgi:hypothetical protein